MQSAQGADEEAAGERREGGPRRWSLGGWRDWLRELWLQRMRQRGLKCMLCDLLGQRTDCHTPKALVRVGPELLLDEMLDYRSGPQPKDPSCGFENYRSALAPNSNRMAEVLIH